MGYLDRSRLRDPLNVGSKFSYLAILAWVNIALSAWTVVSQLAQRARDEGRRGTSDHRGRVPKGFLRTDERIHEDLCSRMAAHPALDATDVDVRVTNGDVALEGTVRTRAESRLAEALAESVGGVRQIRNDLRVTSGGEAPRRLTSVTGTESPSAYSPPRSAPTKP
jgi:hypothetical protein